MDSIIGRLYWNEEFISSINSDADKKEYLQQFNAMTDALLKDKSPEDKELFNEMLAVKNRVNCIEVENAFCVGFKSAFKLFMNSKE